MKLKFRPLRLDKGRIWRRLLSRQILLVVALLTLAIIGGFWIIAGNLRQPSTQPSLKTAWYNNQLVRAQMPGAQMSASLTTKADAAEISVERAGSRLSFTQAISQPTLTHTDDTVTFESDNNLISLEYQLLDNGIKEDIILTADPLTNIFTSSVELRNLKAFKTADQQLVFFDQNDQYQFHFQPPYAVDASGSTTWGVTYHLRPMADPQAQLPTQVDAYQAVRTIDSFRKQLLGGSLGSDDYQAALENLSLAGQAPSSRHGFRESYELIVEVDPGWLHSPERNYPIRIDPTVVHDESSHFAGGNFFRSTDLGSGTSPQIASWHQTHQTDSRTIAYWPMNETSGSTIADFGQNNITATAIGATVVDSMPGFGKARSFNGSSNFICIDTNGTCDGSDVSPFFDQAFEERTIELWFKSTRSSVSTDMLYQEGGLTNGVNIYLSGTALYGGVYGNGLAPSSVFLSTNFQKDTWHHVALAIGSRYAALYLDGELAASARLIGRVPTHTADDSIGATRGDTKLHSGNVSGHNHYFQGLIDEVRISSRAKSSEEIRASASRRPDSYYVSEVIDLSDSVTSLIDFSWTELGRASGGGENPASTSGLIGQWNLNETTGSTAANTGSCGSSCNGTVSGDAVTNGQDVAPLKSGWTALESRWGGGALKFNGSNDRLTIPNVSLNNQNFSISFWAKPAKLNGNYVLSQGTASAGQGLHMGYRDSQRFTISFMADDLDAPATYSTTDWTNWTATYNNSTKERRLYNNGKLVATDTATYNYAGTGNILFGTHSIIAAARYFEGVVDAIQIYDRVLPADEVLANYNASEIRFQTRTSPDGQTWSDWEPNASEALTVDGWQQNTPYTAAGTGGSIKTMSDSFLKTNTTPELDSHHIQTGSMSDQFTPIADWRFEESGTGPHLSGQLFDSSGNGHHGTPTGTTPTQGVDGLGRAFNGTGDHINITNSTDFDLQNFVISAWVWSDDFVRNMGIFEKGPVNTQYSAFFQSADLLYFRTYNSSATAHSLTVTTSDYLNNNEWNHVAFTYDGSTKAIYVNGQLAGSTAYSQTLRTGQTGQRIGALGNTTYYFNGKIDQVAIYPTMFGPSFIHELYRMGSQHLLHADITPTDFSEYDHLEFDIAADRPGNYLNFGLGNSNFASLVPDDDTVAYWKLEETIGQTNSQRAAGGNGFHATRVGSWPGAATHIAGKWGGGSHFIKDSTDYLRIRTSDTSAFALSPPLTFSAWINPQNIGGGKTMGIINTDKVVFASHNHSGIWMDVTNAGLLQLNFGNNTGCASSGRRTVVGGTVLQNNVWYHVAGVYVSNNDMRLYINGEQQDVTYTGTATTTVHNNRLGGIGYQTSCGGVNEEFTGTIDEVRIDSVARSSSEIKNLYEAGHRFHPVSIDFAAKFVSADLGQGAESTSIVIDATPYGFPKMASNLFVDDILIIREQVDGEIYTAQGKVASVNQTTGAVEIAAWDEDSTFPLTGSWPSNWTTFTNQADVFKWQRIRVPLKRDLPADRLEEISKLIIQFTNGHEGRRIWLDNFSLTSSYLDDPTTNIPESPAERYFQYRAIFSSHNPGVSSALTSVTLDYLDNHRPEIPSFGSPSAGATRVSLTPTFTTTTTDYESNWLRYRIHLCTDSNMTQNCQSFDQTDSQTGWSGQNSQSNTAYTSGTQASYLVQTPLNPGTTYYWKTQAIDPDGSTMWGDMQETARSFTTNFAPTAPLELTTNQEINPSAVMGNPEFSAIYADPDSPDQAAGYQIEVATDPSFENTYADFSGSFSPTVNVTARTPDVTYDGPTLLHDGSTYYWRIRLTDVGGLTGAWSAPAHFSTYDLEALYTCSATRAAGTNSVVVGWSDLELTAGGYTIERRVNDGSWASLTSVNYDALTYPDNTVSVGNVYRYRVRSYIGDITSDWCTTSPVSFETGLFSLEGLRLEGLKLD